jgi:hypothetical protein
MGPSRGRRATSASRERRCSVIFDDLGRLAGSRYCDHFGFAESVSFFDPGRYQKATFRTVSSTILTSSLLTRDIVSVRLVIATNAVVMFGRTP